MSTDREKVTFGATVEQKSTSTAAMPHESDLHFSGRPDHLSTIAEKQSVRSNAAHLPSRPVTEDSMAPSAERDPANPFSAFYEHPAARRSAETPRPGYLHPDAARKSPYITEADVESGVGFPISAASTQTNLSGLHKISIERSKECAMWPSQQTLKQQRKADNKLRKSRYNFWARLNKRQKVTVQVLLALLVVGAAVGLGVGISRAVGGGVWSGSGQTKQVPQDNDN